MPLSKRLKVLMVGNQLLTCYNYVLSLQYYSQVLATLRKQTNKQTEILLVVSKRDVWKGRALEELCHCYFQMRGLHV